MKFLIDFDKKLEESPFEVDVALNQTVEDLELIISLNYNHLDTVYLEYEGKALTSKKSVLSDVVNKSIEPVPILIRPKHHMKLADEKIHQLRQNIENNFNLEEVKKFGPVIGIVLAILFLIWVF